MHHVNQAPLKDETREHPIATVWRPVLCEIVKAITEGDYSLSRGIATVAPLSSAAADHIRVYISAYGETPTELPKETWNTSVSQWMETHWEVLVDLWTAESGRSDLVLHVFVFETTEGFRFEVDSVHVP